MTAEEYDRLSILYDDARKALAEADAILATADECAGLRVGTGAALAVCNYLCDESDRYAPVFERYAHSVKA